MISYTKYLIVGGGMAAAAARDKRVSPLNC
jgi:hypothetical protein